MAVWLKLVALPQIFRIEVSWTMEQRCRQALTVHLILFYVGYNRDRFQLYTPIYVNTARVPALVTLLSCRNDESWVMA